MAVGDRVGVVLRAVGRAAGAAFARVREIEYLVRNRSGPTATQDSLPDRLHHFRP